MIRFLLGDREHAVEAARADITILEYLREHLGRTGTKEGCASGDCGACTVVTAVPAGDGLRFQPLNACIATLGSLHGKQLITVEDLHAGTTWHPVQRAMVEGHGSQCGFCTPGFIMSMFALYHDAPDATDDAIHEALGGNLCRCTGYRPIVEATRQALADRTGDRFSEQAGATRERLLAFEAPAADSPALASGSSRYFRPPSRAALVDLLREHPDARLLAGGTDLLLEVTQGLGELPVLVDLCAVPELRRIAVDAGGIRLAAAVSHRDAQAPVLADYPELAELIERFGSLQIRSQGTVGGNVANASPIGDWPPVLLALGARLLVDGVHGPRELPAEAFFLDYRRTALEAGEYLREVWLPRRDEGLLLRAWKISKRFEDDISSLCAVFALRMAGGRISDARVAFGGMAAIPKRAAACEAALIGRDLGRDTLAEAAAALDDDFTPISDARASAAYRRLVARQLLLRLRAEHAGLATRVRGAQQGHEAHGHP